MPDYRLAARRAAQKYGIDPEVFERQIGAESNFNPNAGSPAGARGIAQIMPATAEGWGVDLNDGRVTDDLEAAAKNMSRYIKEFGGWEGALRAYNAGPGAVEKSKGYGETNAYVKKILQGQNPQPSEGGGGGSPRTPDRVISRQVSQLDTEGFQDALREAALGRFLTKRRGPDNLLTRLGAVRTENPSREEFTSTRTVTERTAGTPATSGRSSGGSSPGSNIVKAAQLMDRLGERYGAPVTAKQEPGHATGGDHDPAVKGATARDFGGGEKEREKLFRDITRRLGVKDAVYKGPDINIVRDGLRYQIISRDHGTGPHLHVGIRKAG